MNSPLPLRDFLVGINDVLKQLAQAPDLEQGLQKAMTSLAQVVRADYFWILHRDGTLEKPTTLKSRMALRRTLEQTSVVPALSCRQLPYPEQEDKWLERLEAGEWIEGDRSAFPAGWHPLINCLDPNIQACLGYPLLSNGQLIGFFLLCSFDHLAWEEREKLAVENLSFALAEKLNAEHRLAQEQLYRSSIIAAIPDLIFLIDLDEHRVIYSNDNSFLGYSIQEEEHPLQLFLSLLDPDHRAQAAQQFLIRLTQLQDGEVLDTQYQMRHRDGHFEWIRERAMVFERHANGEVAKYVSVFQNITEQKKTNEELLKSERRYRNFVTYSTEGIYYSSCGQPIPINLPAEEQLERFFAHATIEECNVATAEMYGLNSPLELIGIPTRELSKGRHLAENQRAFVEFIRNGYRSEVILRREIGEGEKGVRHFLTRAVGIVENNQLIGVWTIQQDTTSEREVKKRLASSERVLKTSLSMMPDLKIRLSADGQIEEVYAPLNEESPLDDLAEENRGRHLSDFLPPIVVQGLMSNIDNALLTNRVQTFEFVLEVEGGIYYFEARINTVEGRELMLVLRDVTARREAQQNLQSKISELDEKNRQLQTYIDSNLQLENFAYIASHDLREPVRTMKNFASILQRGYIDQLDDRGRQCLEFIIIGADRMNRLIEDLLTYSRVNTEDEPLTEIPIADLIQEVLQSIEVIITENDATITIEHLPERVLGSETKLKQLFQNLIVNAVKFHQPEVPPNVVISCEEIPGYHQFRIADNGVGIPEDMQEEIFKLFRTFRPNRRYPGTGIGLALCKLIVEQHQGEIWMETQVDEGTTFYFTLQR